MDSLKSTRIAGVISMCAGLAFVLSNSVIILYRTFINTVFEPDYASHAALVAIGAALFVIGHNVRRASSKPQAREPKA